MKNLKKISRSELKTINGGGNGLENGLDPIGGGGFCDTCTDSQQCCLDSNNIYFCGSAGTNCARQ